MAHLFFRADANSTIGYGHVRRCLSVADAVRERGDTATFVCADETVARVIEREGFACDVLGSDYRDMESEKAHMYELVARMAPDTVVVDSYFVTPSYLEGLKELTRTALMDDGAVCAWPLDILVNYNLAAGKADYRLLYAEAGVEMPRLLIGPEYAPLRPAFAQGRVKRADDPPRTVLFIAGGADPAQATLKMVRALRQDRTLFPGIIWRIVIGALCSDKKEIAALAEGDERIVLHEDVQDMASLMREADIAVSAAGSTLYEICASGLPAVAFVTADNQAPLVSAFTDRGIMLYGGDAREKAPFEKQVIAQIQKILREDLLRKTMSRKAAEVTDGQGAVRLAEALTA